MVIFLVGSAFLHVKYFLKRQVAGQCEKCCYHSSFSPIYKWESYFILQNISFLFLNIIVVFLKFTNDKGTSPSVCSKSWRDWYRSKSLVTRIKISIGSTLPNPIVHEILAMTSSKKERKKERFENCATN